MGSKTGAMSETTGKTVFEVTAENFQREVIERSMTTPVLIDFWAEWCGPCKTLGPVLEGIADDYGGSFLLGKVDADREQDLTAAFQVQGIPFCVLVDGGRPVDGFQGAVPETEVRRFLQKHGIGPAMSAGEDEAKPEDDPDSPAARIQRAVLATRDGNVEAAREVLEGFPEEDERIGDVERLRDSLRFLEHPLDEGKGGAEAELFRARQQFLAGDLEAAMTAGLEAVQLDKAFAQGLPRQAMLLCFLILGEDDERVDDYRRRLATLLY
jgi:putative thioredoxin